MSTNTKHQEVEKKAAIFEALSNYDVPTIQRFQKRHKKPDLKNIPGDGGLPLIGHAIPLLRNLHAWMDKGYASHGKIFRINVFGSHDGVLLLGPEANKLVFQNEGKIFSNHLAYDSVLKDLFNNAVLARDFSDHKTLRKTLQAAFKREAIEGHIDIMNPIIKKGLSSWQTGTPIKAMNHLKELLLITGAEVFLGVNTGPETKKINQAFVNIVDGTADPVRQKAIWFSPYAKGVRGNKYLSAFILKEIPLLRLNPGRDLLSHFCHLTDDEGKGFSDEEICDQILFVLFAAHDTTTSALSAILYALASNQAWQQTLRQEILSLNKQDLAFDDAETMQKTDWTFKEALRMFPALSIFGRYTLEEFEFKGHTIPANTPITISPLFTHYMPEYWSNPHTFDPERFSPERAEDKKDFYQYLPFGGGAHKCLGMHFAQIQAKLFLFHLLKHYKVSKDPKMTQYKYNNIPLTFPTGGLPLTFSKI